MYAIWNKQSSVSSFLNYFCDCVWFRALGGVCSVVFEILKVSLSLDIGTIIDKNYAISKTANMLTVLRFGVIIYVCHNQPPTSLCNIIIHNGIQNGLANRHVIYMTIGIQPLASSHSAS